MFTTPEQFSAAAKTNFEAQIAALTALTTNAFESVTKIVDLNSKSHQPMPRSYWPLKIHKNFSR